MQTNHLRLDIYSQHTPLTHSDEGHILSRQNTEVGSYRTEYAHSDPHHRFCHRVTTYSSHSSHHAPGMRVSCTSYFPALFLGMVSRQNSALVACSFSNVLENQFHKICCKNSTHSNLSNLHQLGISLQNTLLTRNSECHSLFRQKKEADLCRIECVPSHLHYRFYYKVTTNSIRSSLRPPDMSMCYTSDFSALLLSIVSRQNVALVAYSF